MTDLSPPTPLPTSFSMKSIGRSTAMLSVGVGIGQVFGLLRSLFVASAVGVSSEFDAILVAMVLPTVLAIFLTSSIRVALIPAYIDITHRSGRDAAQRFLGALLSYSALGVVGTAALVVLFPGPPIAVAGPGLSQDARQLALGYVPIFAPLLAFLAMSNLVTAVCQIGRQFRPIAIASGLGPLASLLVTLGFWDRLGIVAYAVGTTVGAGTTLVILAAAAHRQGLLPRPSLRFDRLELGRFARHVLPMTAGSAVLQLNPISDRAVATLLAAGAASALKYGQQIVSEPAAALSNSWATVVYPAVVEAGGPRSVTSMGSAMNAALRFTLAIFVPLMVATVAFAPLVVSVVYGRGAFDRDAVRTTSIVAAAFAPMLLLNMIQPVFIAAHNARRRGSLMAVTAISNAVMNLVLNLVLGSIFGVAGIALSSSLTLGFLLLFLAWRVPAAEGFRAREAVSAGGRALAASLVPGIPIAAFVWFVARDAPAGPAIAILLAAAMAGAVGYVLSARLFGLPEPGVMVGAAGRMVRRRFSPSHAE